MGKKVQQKKEIKKKKRRKLKVKFLLKTLLCLCIIVVFFLYVYSLKIKNIYIKGNDIVSDALIIETIGIKDYPKIYKLNIKKSKKLLLENPLIDEVKIKRNIFGKLTINIKEAKVLFYYKYSNKYITSSNKSIDSSNEYLGVPTLINFTPDTVFKELVNGLNKIDYNIVKSINEIEYNPYKGSDGTIIDNNRFNLKMIDGNTVVIDTVNIKNLNSYNTIFVSLGMDKTKGVLYLDTITEDNIYFKSYESMAKEEKEKEEQEKEKS